MTAFFPDLVVNGETVPSAVVAAEAQNHDGPKGKPGIAWRKAANAIAVRTLLLQEARRQKIAAAPASVGAGKYETDEEALVRGLLETVIVVKAPATEDARAHWAKDPERYKSPPLWEVSHILFACDPSDEEQKQVSLKRANSVLERVGSQKFSKLAAEFSDCGSKKSGGALGQLGPGDTVPEFEAALRKLDAGDCSSEPVLTRHGWHIIRMDDVAPGQVLPFESVRQAISNAMEKAAWLSAAREYVAELIEAADITGADLKAPVS